MKVTGLGMAIESLIEAHEGMIEVDSILKEGTLPPLLTSCQQKNK